VIRGGGPETETFYEYSPVLKISSFIVMTFGYLAIGWSRMVLGAHSLNQVIYGFLLGALSICLFFSIL
jgi:membrane-associated phospholipid phosphatase